MRYILVKFSVVIVVVVTIVLVAHLFVFVFNFSGVVLRRVIKGKE